MPKQDAGRKKTNKRASTLLRIISLSWLCLLTFCQTASPVKQVTYSAPPEWAKHAVWYQIFPERFRNGDPANDPTIETLQGTWPYEVQTSWQITPWTDDWYKLQPWEKENSRGFYYNAQLRRYGGDIQGIIDRLDYLQELGVNAIYLNPVFESPSSHKYGCAMYRHIDNNFGPNPSLDEKIWSSEDPDDPTTWKWTTADSLFLSLVKQLHERNMRIIIDGVFNHVGIPFWAFQDVRQNGTRSKYIDWFIIKKFDDPSTPEDEFSYQGWYGIKDLPEINENEKGPPETFRRHIRDIVRRWMDPDGDGNPSDGIDGWRLDVADMVSKEFWRDFRNWVREVNPEAYLTGEVWWEDYPRNKMFDASPWLQGDIFDAVMNYRFADAMLKAFIDRKNQILPTELDRLLGEIRKAYPPQNQYVLQNLMDSHDTERFSTMLLNPDRWIDHGGNLQYNKNFKINRPDDNEREIQKTILTFQFTYIGAPYIYYGDEAGMWGADDPDCRKPMIWQDMKYEPETHHPFNLPRPADRVEFDADLFNFYKKVIQLRKNHPALQTGKYQTLIADDASGLFAFERTSGKEKIIAIFNLSDKKTLVNLSELLHGGMQNWDLIFGKLLYGNYLKPRSYVVFQGG